MSQSQTDEMHGRKTVLSRETGTNKGKKKWGNNAGEGLGEKRYAEE